MANEIQWRGTETGVTLYATIRSATGTQWNTAGTPNFEAVTAANWTDYDIALAETTGNYFYVGTFPAISGNMVAGWYWVDVYKRAGGTPAITDTLQGTIVGYWDGTSLLPWASNAKTVSDKSEYSLTATTGLGNQTANITGTVSGNSTHSAADVKTAIEAAGSHLTLILEDTGTTLPATLSTILTDTDELQKAITDGGRTDLLIDAIKAKTDYLPSTTAGAAGGVFIAGSNAATTVNITGTVSGNSTHSASDVVTALGTGSTLTSAASGLLTTQMTESYAAKGVAPTVAQSLFMLLQRLTEFHIDGVTVTVDKLDNATTAYTLTLDSDTTPTSSTRAT